MLRNIQISWNSRASLWLGLIALAINCAVPWLTQGVMVPLGDVFLLISAGAYGLGGAAISSAVGVIPNVMIIGDSAYGLRALALTMFCGYLAPRHPRLPIFVATLCLWVFVLGPLGLYSAKVSGPLAENLSAGLLLSAGFIDILLALVAGSFLLNPTFWSFLTRRARPLSISSLFIHIITTCSILVLLGATAIFQRVGPVVTPEKLDPAATSVVFILIVSVGLPALLAYWLSVISTHLAQELASGTLLSNTQARSFSGLSRDFWRKWSLSRESFLPPRSEEAQAKTQTTTPPAFKYSTEGALPPTSGAAICALNKNGTIVFVNAAFRDLAEIRQGEVIGKDIRNIAMNKGIQTHLIGLLDHPSRRERFISELKLNKLPEKLRFLEISSQTAYAPEQSSRDGGPESIIITLKDITDRRTVDLNVLEGQKLESLGTLVSGLGHVLNNALTAISGQASCARHAKSPAQTEAALAGILKATQEAGTLVRRLLDFAELGSSNMTVAPLEKMLEDQLELLRRVVGETYEIIFEKPNENPAVQCDINLITQALTNLVLNARDAYPARTGQIWISLAVERFDETISDTCAGARPGEYVRLRVKDAGSGMTPEVLAHAFEPLFTTKSHGGHTGLGLPTVFAIVRAHDGFLSVESQPEKGSTISIYLPIHQAAQEKAEPAQTEMPQAQAPSEQSTGTADMPGNPREILVIDDDDNIREVVGAMLTTLGYKVDTCKDGIEALKRCEQSRFDLVIVDLIMPKILGLDLVEKIKGASPGTKALIMTGYGYASEDVSKQNILPKPFDIDALERAVRQSLQTRSV